MDGSTHQRPIEFRASGAADRLPRLACSGASRRTIPAGCAAANFLRGSHRITDTRAQHRLRAIPSSAHFSRQEIPARKTDLTTVIVRRRFARFSHDEATFYADFCRV
ncbi:hypothetical protein [Burkholderia stabilis]|uniref:hypothetical protein n=1 Tax=Burkholderia stabilis TaxID=95485 RepID=UPI001F0C9158|nr:hypothetical protein [Burkholderia stabilis]